jgi:hypothetical protein
MRSQILLQLFREELVGIRQRHAIVFPFMQLKLIKAVKLNGKYVLKFLEGYNLPGVITMEIELAFKFVFMNYNNGSPANND